MQLRKPKNPSFYTTPVVGVKKVILVLHLCSKCSFTSSKLRFLALRAPKNHSFYTTPVVGGV
jgi:hypothetical protein